MGAGYRMLSYGGNYTQDGLKKGMNENQAVMYGETMAGMETLMDTLGDKLKGVAIGKAKTTTGFKSFIKTGLKELGINATVEGLGEAVTEPIQELVATAFGGKADYDNIGERMWQSFLGGFASEALMTGASLGYGGSVNAYNKIKNGEQITLDELKGALKEIDQKDEVDLEKMLVNNFNFTADELYRNTDVQQNREQKLEGIAEELSSEEKRQIMINESDLDDDQKEVLSEITNQYNLSDEDVKKAIQNTKDGKYNNLEQIEGTTAQNNEVLNQEQQTIQDETKTAQNETSQQPSEYTTNLMKSIDNYNNSRQEGQEIFDINNEETRKEIESIQKVAENRGINITFDESRFDNTNTNAFYEYDKDGNVANIVLNPNSTSKKYVQNLVIHEMAHSFEGNKEYDSLSKAILDYAKSKGEYKNAFDDLMKTYSKVYSGENLNKIVEKEAVANILGEKLGDKEFVDSLVNNQYVERSTIQKIIDFVKNQINRFKGYKDQEQYWNYIKTLYEEAYNKSKVSKEGLKNGKLRYSIGGEKSLTANIDKLNEAKKLKEDGKSTVDIYKQTGWYESIDGKWKYEIDDSNFNLKENLIEKDTTYDLEEILDAPELFKAYPKLKEVSVSFDDLGDSTKGEKYSRMGFDYITLNNDLINESASKKDYDLLGIKNQSEVYSTLMHEIQHVIQGYEGFAKGSNIDFWSNTIKDIDRKYEKTQNDYQRFKDEIGLKEYEDKLLQDWKKDKITGKELTQRIDNYIEEKGYTEKFDRLAELQKELLTQKYKLEDTTPGTLYFFTAGELEAREVQNRINKDSEWRKQNLPQENGMAVFVEDFTDKITDSYSSKTTTKDSQGRELSKGQQEFFKDSKVRDENGNLLEVYHGTPVKEDINVYDSSKAGSNVQADFTGIYFTDNIDFAEQFAHEQLEGSSAFRTKLGERGQLKKQYLNITNPLNLNELTDVSQIEKYIDEEKASEFSKEAMIETLKRAIANKNSQMIKFNLDLNKISQDYDGIIADLGGRNKGSNEYIVFNSNQVKNIDNTNPTNNPDIRYSQDTTGAWNNFIEKYFKNEGEGTAIKDLKKLPTREYTIQDYEEVINNSANIPEADKKSILKDLEGIELNKQSLNDFKQYVEDLDNNYKEVAQEQEQQRFENKNYKDEGRANLISEKRKEFNTNMEYDDSVVAELDEIIPRNRNGKRTVAEWKNMAKQLGQRIANLSPEQIEDIAVKSYYDLEPTKAITRYDNQSKTNVGYEQLYANDWVNEVYEGVRENRQFSVETENQENKLTQKELPKTETQLPTRDTSLEEDIEAFRQETRKVTDKTKERKHLETYATSESVGKEGRKVARELYNSEQYVPISNRETMTKANTKIQTGGVENTYTELTNRFKTNEKMTLQDIATGERLIQIYSAQGDYAKVNELMQDVAILGTELGQQVQALSIIKKASPEGQLQLLNRLVERTNNKQNTDIKITDEQAEKILKSKNKEELDNNVSEVTLELAQQLPISMKDKIRSWRYLSMLGNFRTHIRNIVGNVAMNVLQNTKNKVAGAGEDIASIFNKNFERTKTFKGATKEQKAYAKADSYIMENVLENGGKYSAETLLDQNKRQFDNKILNKIADINSSLLEKEDTVFLRTAYRQALQGYMSANKITAQEMENNPKVANKARQYAIEQAQEATFHQFNALASTLNQIEEKGGVAGALTSAILPFKKTPLNIAKTGIEYSPINIMRAVGGTISDITQTNKDLQSQLNKGKITQEEYNSEISSIVNNRIDQMAKGLTGTALGVLGYALSKMGVLKATNKDDEDEFEESLGKQEFSIQIGDNTYSLDWLAPTAIPLFIGANIQELFNETGKELNEEGEEKSFYDRVGDTLNTTVTGLTQAFEPMTEMSMLQGLASALSSYEQDSSNKIFDIGASALSSYAGQFVPTALGQVAKTIDPVVRDTSSTKKGFAKKVDQFVKQQIAKTPVLSKTLPSKSDVWGEEKTRADNILQRFVETAVLPYNREKVIDDMTSEQLKDVFRETGESGTLPKNPQKYFTVNKQKYNLTSEEYNNAKKIYGKTAKSILDDVTKTQQYKDLDKDIKVKLLKDIYSYAKEEIKVDYSNKKKFDYEPKVNNSANKYKTIQTYKQNKNIEELLKLYNKD